MNRENELKAICLDVLSKNGIEESFKETISEDITIAIMNEGYVRFDSIALDPQRCVQLLATILNGFRAEHPFVVMEKIENEDTQEPNEDTCESSPGCVC